MTFRYTYRLSDGSWHEDELSASDRPTAYETLKGRGIRPVKVWCPNPPWLPVSRRWIAIAVLSAACIVLGVLVLRRPDAIRPPSALPRHRILSAPADFPVRVSGLFTRSAERFLALNAQPGLPYPVDGESLKDLAESLEQDVLPSPGDPDWAVELKRIVLGMKAEAAILLQSGKTTAEIERWLRERQKMEVSYRNRIIMAPGTPDEKAARLKTMGL